VSAAPAKVGLHVRPDLRIARIRLPIQQGLGSHDHARDAIAALRRLFQLECPLNDSGVRCRPQPFDCPNGLAFQHRNGRQARERRVPVDLHRASPALAETAAILRSVEFEVVPQDVQERGRRVAPHDSRLVNLSLMYAASSAA